MRRVELMQSGHWNPTGTLIMQSGQMLREQREHEI
jgi:hypothetical protein